jgi:translation initiation factor 2 gamma subunit (eIF-2gamma)
MKRVKSLKSKASMQNKSHMYLLSGQVCLKINVCGHLNYICVSVKVQALTGVWCALEKDTTRKSIITKKKFVSL